jgi:hypothetical protein
MIHRGSFGRGCLPWLLCGVLVSTASAQVPLQQVPQGYRSAGQQGYPSYQQPINPQQAWSPAQQQQPYRVAERTTPLPTSSTISFERQPNEHPLMPALRWANQGLQQMEQLHDYSATLVKRERVNGQVGNQEWMFIKVRHEPFSVYMLFLKPAALKGQEVIYVKGANDGKMWAHPTGIQQTLVGTVSIPPDGMLAMRGQRYPITELGLKNLVRRLLEVGGNDTKYGECDVQFSDDAKINGRPCTLIQVVHPVPRRNFLFYLARIYVDRELNVPIRYEAHDWPREPGAEPELIEEYTYLDLKLNPGFTDADFDIHNPNYQFKGR